METQIQTIPKAPPPAPPIARSEARQIALADGVWASLIDSLPLYERDARQIEKVSGVEPELQHMLGYRSVPEPLRWRIPQIKGRDATRAELDGLVRRAHAPLDAMSDEEFFDWLIYSKEPVPNPLSGLPSRFDESPVIHAIIEGELQNRFGLISGIPGLYHDGDCLRVKLSRSGVIVPARVDGLIRALQHYPDPSSARFFWLSSNGLTGGASMRASLHIVNAHRVVADGAAIIVTHTMRADAEGWTTGGCVIAVNGISPLRLPHLLRAALPELRACAVASDLGDVAARTLKENRFLVEVFGQEGAGDE